MGSITDLTVAGYPVLETKSSVVPEAMSIFRESDKRVFLRKISDRNALVWGEPDSVGDEDCETAVVYTCETTKVIDRLNVMGFTMKRVRKDFEAIRKEKIEKFASGALEGESDWILEDWNFYKNLTFEDYEMGLRKVMTEGIRPWRLDKEEKATLDPIVEYIVGNNEDFYFGFLCSDIRSFLRLACELVAPTSEVIQDITDLVSAGYYAENEPVCQNSNNALTVGHPENSLRIILTEGSTDVEFLRESLLLLYPHLAEYYSFLDFAPFRSQGGAGSLVTVIKSFAAAGITNRIIAIFDNDAAAFDARRSLETIPIPTNIAICNYPNLTSLSAYPTLGPGGIAALDVNGLAASIELYLGQDVLTNDNGNFPVQWKGFIGALRKYQGEVMHKPKIHDAFQKKLKSCRSSQEKMAAADWDGLRAIFDVIFHAFD